MRCYDNNKRLRRGSNDRLRTRIRRKVRHPETADNGGTQSRAAVHAIAISSYLHNRRAACLQGTVGSAFERNPNTIL